MPPLGLPLPPYDCGVLQGSLELKLYLLLLYGDNSSFLWTQQAFTSCGAAYSLLDLRI